MNDQIKLTQYSKGAGCGCKIAPKDLQEILSDSYTCEKDEHLLVGNDTNDDAAALQMENGQVLIATTDFFTPIVDDAFDFGRIAAANAISDIYAMGGKPVLAIGILGWPIGKIPNAVAKEVIRGARTICKEANIAMAGGHSIDSPEPFFGLSVNGINTNQQLKRNSTARPGDVIYITKPIGSGLLSTAMKRGQLNEALYKKLLDQLTKLNSEGFHFGKLDYVHAMTDITGFSLLGHLLEVCSGSKVTAEIHFTELPLMEGVNEIIAKFIYPDNTMRNYQAIVNSCEGLNGSNMFTLCDPQTNGGLMVTVGEKHAAEFEQECNKIKCPIYKIGKIKPENGEGKKITIV